VSFAPNRVNLHITGTRKTSSEPHVKLTIAQALLKGQKMDGLIRQLTEIGIHHWQPFIADRSISRPNTKKGIVQTTRWKKIAIEAVKQCRRAHAPLISSPVHFSDALDHTDAYSIKLILWEKATEPLSHHLPKTPLTGIKKVFLMLGPEGGFTEAEIEAASTQGLAAVSLGPRVLRAETATLTASVLIIHHLDNFG
jgi:16S rRNA (uracil1498-N3)-methyltransferase